MDAYTARCLQVSTNGSDTVPPQLRGRPDVLKRKTSSIDTRSVPMRPTHSRSKTSIGAMWPVQTDVAGMPQYPASMTPMSMQSYNFSSPPSGVSPFGTPFQMPYMTPVTPFTPGEWNMPLVMDQKHLQGLGMDFEQDFASNGEFDEVVHMNNGNGSESWEMPDLSSPERRSSGSGSDVTELTESTAAHSRHGSVFENNMGRDERRSRSMHRHSRSLSRTPASRAASKRAHRRQLSCNPGTHSRNTSVCGFMPPLPQTPALTDEQADGLAMEFSGVDFMNTAGKDEDLNMDQELQNSFDAFIDVPMSVSQSSSSHSARLMTPPSDSLFWEHGFDASEVFGQPSHHVEEHSHHGGCCSSSADDEEKPDLFESLRQEASNPPEEDMHPEDPDMIPQEQEPRFDGDLYTPRWVRGQGNKREGYCGLCKPGRWLVLKNSAYWYDKSFTHGISAATGQPFEGPRETRRMAGNPDVWEGLCGGCGDWIALVSSKKKGTTWFRHAYKCHGKNKDAKKSRQSTPPAGGNHAASYQHVKPMAMQAYQPHQQMMPQQPPHDMFHMQQMHSMNAMAPVEMNHGNVAAFSDMNFL